MEPDVITEEWLNTHIIKAMTCHYVAPIFGKCKKVLISEESPDELLITLEPETEKKEDLGEIVVKLRRKKSGVRVCIKGDSSEFNILKLLFAFAAKYCM